MSRRNRWTWAVGTLGLVAVLALAVAAVVATDGPTSAAPHGGDGDAGPVLPLAHLLPRDRSATQAWLNAPVDLFAETPASAAPPPDRPAR